MTDAERIERLERVICSLDANVQLLLGRANGVHASFVVIARTLTPVDAARAAENLRRAVPQQQAALEGTPLTDAEIAEHLRVMQDMVQHLEWAASSGLPFDHPDRYQWSPKPPGPAADPPTEPGGG